MEQNPLSLWRSGPVKSAIIRFVETTTREESPDFIAPLDRIAVFDNDGTLWVEQPMYTQLRFLLDTIITMAPGHPEWARDPVLNAAIQGDLAALAAHGMHGIVRIAMAGLAHKDTEQVRTESLAWIQQAKHPRFDRLYTDLIYAPQLQLLDYLRDHGYRPFIVSGGGLEFMRAITEDIYRIPADQVIGSAVVTEYSLKDATGVLTMKPEVYFVDDGPGKPVGNSDGDFEMLEYTTSGDGPGLGILVHHDDGAREYAYDRETAFGRLDRGLEEAESRGWLLVSMKQHWEQIFAGDGESA